MNTNNAAKFDSHMRRNLYDKNVYLWPLRFSFLLGLTMGVLMLMAMPAPSAHASTIVTYFNFNDPPNDFTSDAGQSSTISEVVNPPVAGGQFITSLTYTNPNQMTFDSGTTVNEFTGAPSDSAADDLAGLFGALDINGNTTGGGSICFQFTVNTTGLTGVSLSFALASVGNGGQFNDLLITYTTSSNSTPTTIVSLTGLASMTSQSLPPAYTKEGPFSLGTGADNQTSVTIEFCFSGSSNSDTRNHTFVDNIQVTAVPEPSTYIGGLLGIVGLCWQQRRRLIYLLRLRRA